MSCDGVSIGFRGIRQSYQ